MAHNFKTSVINLFSIPGKLKHVTVSKNTLFGVNKDDNIYMMTKKVFDAKGNLSFKWKHIAGKLKNIAVMDI